MTVTLAVQDIAGTLEEKVPGSVEKSDGETLLVRLDALPDVAAYLKDTDGLEFDYLNYITAVDYYTYFEIVYRLTSLVRNHTMVIKTRCQGRENLSVPSVIDLWQTADFQEREIFDLFGITFDGHPNMKRIFLWEGYDGHPLRKDFNR
ncbi:MAG: NADH-quinone oxidoreductase subunit C [Dehalococcoidales bacterium]|nr:NADH-quinone oxidoreductase subunit C [Dehalococcoidales bacterium]